VVEWVVPAEESELAADRLWSAGACAVRFEDGATAAGPAPANPAPAAGAPRPAAGPAPANPGPLSPIAAGPAPVILLTASFPSNDAAATVAAELAGEGARLAEVDPSWADEWRRWAQPVDVGGTLTIVPARLETPARNQHQTARSTLSEVPLRGRRASRIDRSRQASRIDRSRQAIRIDRSRRAIRIDRGRRVIRIDPGRVFGSGSHASTRMLLAELDRRPPAELSVLDLGCGSGILGVVAAVLGAGAVWAVDTDPEALDVTAANSAANGVSHLVRTSTRVPPGPFDLALVNLTAAVHVEVGPTAVGSTRPGGTLLLAGLLPRQWRHVAGAYAGADVAAIFELDDWEGLELVRSGSSSPRAARASATPDHST
jgi:ribosomal protein L11 methylase PrmA